MSARVLYLLLLLGVLGLVMNLQVIPERTIITALHKKYFSYLNFTVKRYGRKSGYYMNIDLGVLYYSDNNLTMNAVFNQFLHNEYRRSFVEFHYKLCDLVNKEPYIGGTLARGGMKCPVYPGRLFLPNMTVPTENFPSVFPFEKGRIDFTVTSTATGEVLIGVNLLATFKK